MSIRSVKSPSDRTPRRSFQGIRHLWQQTWQQTWQQASQRLPLQDSGEPEHSIPLRVAVQALVTVGIVATDWAAADVVDSLGVSVWAVPVSAIGASWSWYRRRGRNGAVKFGIAIAMLIALGLFLAQLFVERGDTRLALAELLIQLQVFHSFDMPRRKDLGYSVVIGLILIGVAATLSQTLTFAPLLLVFLMIAIPVLVLDYRSRLGLETRGLQQMRLDLAPRKLGVLLLVTVGLGLTVFLLIPRFPGYQLRTFPVSAPIPLQQEFESSAILNPGSGNQQDTNGAGLGETISGSGEITVGQMDPDLYYGFNQRIDQNLRGALVPRVVMRVRSQAPGFWRVLAFDRYLGQGWEISRNADPHIQILERPAWSLRFSLPWSFTRNRTREVVQSYTIVSDLPNLIPALYQAKELYFPTTKAAIDPEGTLRAPVPLTEGITYTVVSEVPYRDRTQLRQADTKLPRSIAAHYLQVPEAIVERVKQKTEQILAQSPTPLTVASEKALYLAQYLKQTYRIQPDLRPLGADEDLVTAFLFNDEGGYPDHFATTLTVMLRSIGIPARLVMGFGPGEFNPFTGFYVIHNTDAYAMTEVYFPKYGWFSFDPIPGHPLVPVSIEESRIFGVLQQFWNWVAGWLPSPVAGWLNGLFYVMAKAIGGWVALFTRGWFGVLAGLVILTSLGFLGWLSWQGWQQWRYRRWLAKLPPMEALYQQMVQWLDQQGFRKSPAQTPLEYAQSYQQQTDAEPASQVTSRTTPETAAVIERLSQAYVGWRYGQESPDLGLLQREFERLKRSKQSRSNV